MWFDVVVYAVICTGDEYTLNTKAILVHHSGIPNPVWYRNNLRNMVQWYRVFLNSTPESLFRWLITAICVFSGLRSSIFRIVVTVSGTLFQSHAPVSGFSPVFRHVILVMSVWPHIYIFAWTYLTTFVLEQLQHHHWQLVWVINVAVALLSMTVGNYACG